MPATAGTLEYVQTSELNAAQLRGVDATALRTGDLAFLTSTKQFYYLDKASVAADDGVNVITTKGAVTSVFPLGDPAIPGRWLLGPCVPCGTGVTLPDESPGYAELAVDSQKVDDQLSELLGIAVLASGGASLEVQADTSGDNDTANGGGDFVVAMDGVNIRGFGWTTSLAGRTESGGITLKILNVPAGFHHISLLWATRSLGTLRIRPVTNPRSDHASLLVREVNT